ncbi:MAG: hypothetical protein IJV22_08265 [Bacteroidales bacterium]|nr:hypothetical protein [Bacteroidales bacterium]
MIRMDYGDKSHIKSLKEKYKSCFPDMAQRQPRWVSLRRSIIQRDRRFRGLLPIQFGELLVLDFECLADIYEVYVSLGLSKTDDLTDDGKSLFSYDKHKDRNGNTWDALQPVIAKFFMDTDNGFEIHTCHYCDMAYVNAYTMNGGKKAQFDLDHVLNKAKCPIIGLSLFNFVPACQMCNGSRIKGQKQLYSSAALRKKLSPTNTAYDFERIVTIEVHNKHGVCSTFGFEKRMDEYEIKFNSFKDPDYSEVVKAFHLEERYNYHKCEALRLLDLKERYTDARIMELARLMVGDDKAKATPHGMRIITQIKHDIFSLEFKKHFHRSFGKLQNDVLK